MTDRRVIFEPFAKQREFLEAFFSGAKSELTYGGAIRGGKTYLGIALILLLCKVFPGSRWGIGRATLPRIRQNTLPVFNKLRPQGFCGEVNKSSWTATCTNGSEILFIAESIKDDPDLNKMRGFEVNGFLNEEGNETTVKFYQALQERVGTWHIPGLDKQPPAFIMNTCNPGQSWIKEMFHDPFVAGKLPSHRYFLQATAEDNPYISDEQKERWRKTMLPHLYRRYVLGDWTVTDDPMQVIPYEDLHNVLVQPEDIQEVLDALPPDDREESLGIDYGGQGEDLTAFAHMRGPVLYELATMAGLTQGEVATRARVKMAEKFITPSRVGVDAIGEGSGVWGNLKDAGLDVHRVIAGGGAWDLGRSASERAIEMQFKNLKAQIWWLLRRDIMDPDSGIRILHDPALVQDLLAHRYEVSNERAIGIESKDEVKKRIGRSPDRGDAAVIANLVRQMRPAEIGYYVPEDIPEIQHFTSIWS